MNFDLMLDMFKNDWTNYTVNNDSLLIMINK